MGAAPAEQASTDRARLAAATAAVERNGFTLACAVERPTEGDDPWFGTVGYQGAIEECRACPVQRECRAAGMHEEFGIWGGVNRKVEIEADPSTRPTRPNDYGRKKRAEAARAMHDGGLTNTEIATELGVTLQAVWTYLREEAS